MPENSAGPAQYVVVRFADPADARAGFERLIALRDSGAVTLCDVEFLRSIKGVASTVAPSRIDPSLAVLDSADARLLSQGDLDVLVEALGPGEVTAVVVHTGSAPTEVLGSWGHGGARIAGHGPVDDDVLTGEPDAVEVRVLRHRAG